MLNTYTATLRSLAQQRGIFFGAAASWQALRTDYAYRDTLAREFNLLTPENEMKSRQLLPRRNVYDFSPSEDLVNFAQANDMKVRGHTLLWHQSMPDWQIEGNYNRNQAMDLLRKHIFTVMGHYRGEIYAWDVVNEVINDEGGLRESFWLHTIGPDYIEYAFRWASEADPNARLFINDYNIEGLSPKANSLYELTTDLLQRGVPVHGVGLQMHLAPTGPSSGYPQVEEIGENMDRLAELGLEIHITEMDVQIQNLPGSQEERLNTQAEIYAAVLRQALRQRHMKAFVLWGFSDRYSWIPKFTGNTDAALIFNEYFQPKPAYDAIYQVLENE
jgi:endo-1,4-beta-xylanase